MVASIEDRANRDFAVDRARRTLFGEIQAASSGLEFTAVTDRLATSALVLAFEAAFEPTAFASFEIAGVHAGLQDDIHVATGTHWSDWFAQMGWDHGWIITDLRAARVRVVCAS